MEKGTRPRLQRTIVPTLCVSALLSAWACAAIPSYGLASAETSVDATFEQDAGADLDARLEDRDAASPVDASDASGRFKYRVFVSSNAVQGAFAILPDGGTNAQAEADKACVTDYEGHYPGTNAKFRALLWVDNNDPRKTFGNDAPFGWYNVGDTQDLPVLSTLSGNPIPSRAILNVVGQAPAQKPWVGSSTNNCSGWTYGGSSAFAPVGSPDIPSQWFSDGTTPVCASAHTFYCFQVP
ncbi:MAG: hypothetical protein U0174_24955 [Polyangiaceae bacterium]